MLINIILTCYLINLIYNVFINVCLDQFNIISFRNCHPFSSVINNYKLSLVIKKFKFYASN